MIAGTLTVLAIAIWRGVHVAAWRELDQLEYLCWPCDNCTAPTSPLYRFAPHRDDYRGVYCAPCWTVIFRMLRRAELHA